MRSTNTTTRWTADDIPDQAGRTPGVPTSGWCCPWLTPRSRAMSLEILYSSPLT
jgi:hypothetical protein